MLWMVHMSNQVKANTDPKDAPHVTQLPSVLLNIAKSTCRETSKQARAQASAARLHIELGKCYVADVVRAQEVVQAHKLVRAGADPIP